MQYVRFTYMTPYASCNDTEAIAFERPRTEDELQDIANDNAADHAAGYEYLATSDFDMGSEEYDEAIVEFWESVEGYYDIITEQEWLEEEGTIYK